MAGFDALGVRASIVDFQVKNRETDAKTGPVLSKWIVHPTDVTSYVLSSEGAE